MIKGGGKNLVVSLAAVIAGLGVLAAATLFLNACGARHDEKATADNAANGRPVSMHIQLVYYFNLY